jgi:hypothetical protein
MDQGKLQYIACISQYQYMLMSWWVGVLMMMMMMMMMGVSINGIGMMHQFFRDVFD